MAFDEKLHGVHSSKRKSGWQKNMEWAAKKKPETQSEAELSCKVGDFLKKVRLRRALPQAASPSQAAPKRLKAEDGSPVPATPAPATPAPGTPAVALAAPSTPGPATPATPAPATPAPAKDDIFDLDTKEGICALLKKMFKEAELKACSVSVEDFDRVTMHFCKWLLDKKPRNTALSKHFRSVSFDRDDFSTSKSRKKWLQFWSRELRTRYVRLSDL